MCQHRLLILRSRDLSIPGELFKFFFFWGGGGGGGKEDLVRVLKKGSVDRCTLILSNFGPIRRPPVGSMVKALVS